MAKDKPGFLQNIGDDEEERETLSVLQDEPEVEATPTVSEDGEKKEDKTVDEKKDTGVKKEEVSVEDKKKGVNTEEKVEGGKSDTAKENRIEEKDKPDGKAPALIMGKYKSVEELEKAHMELQRTLTRITDDMKKGGVSTDKKNSPLEIFKKQSFINPRLPDPMKYYFKNEKGEEVLDLASFMNDSFKSFGIAIQQSLLGGPLAAAVYGMLGDALLSEQDTARQEAMRDKEATSIWENIQKEFPVLKTDEELQGLFEKAIYGEKYKRAMEARANNTEPKELTVDEYMALAKGVVRTQPKPVSTPDAEPTEGVKGDAALKDGSGGGPEEGILRDIQDMVDVKRKSIF